MNATLKKKKKAVFQYIFIGIFFLALLLPITLTTLFSSDVSWAAVKGNIFERTSALLAQKTDTLWTKPYMMNTVAYVNYRLFNATISEQTFLGKYGELFYKAQGVAIDDMLGQNVVSEEKLQSISQTQQAIHQRLAEKGVQYLLVIAPAKENVYTDYVSGQYRREGYVPTAKTQIVNALRANTDVEILDLTDAIVEETQAWTTYLHTDSHWNTIASLRGYQEIIRYLQETYPSLPLLSLDDFDISYKNRPASNLAALSHLDPFMEERNMPLLTPQDGWRWQDARHSVTYDDPGRPDINGAAVSMIINENPGIPEQPRVMVIGDSFVGDSDSPWGINAFMSESFSRYVRYHYYASSVDIGRVLIEESDIVIQFYLENNLSTCLDRPYTVSWAYDLDTPLYFTEAGDFTATPYFSTGLGEQETEFTWSEGDCADAIFVFGEKPPRDLELAMEVAQGYYGQTPTQEVRVYANGQYVGFAVVEGEEQTLTFTIPQAVVAKGTLSLHLEFPDATTMAGSTRKIALALKSMNIRLLP